MGPDLLTLLEQRLEAEGIDLTEEPYSDKVSNAVHLTLSNGRIQHGSSASSGLLLSLEPFFLFLLPKNWLWFYSSTIETNENNKPTIPFLCYTREVIDMMKQQLEKLKKDYKDQKRPVVETAMGS